MWAILKEILHEIYSEGLWAQIYASFCCLGASWFILKKLQKKKDVLARDYLLFFLWLSGFFWWVSNFLALGSIKTSLSAAEVLLKSAAFFLILHLYFFLPVLFCYLIFNKKIQLLLDIILGGSWFSFMFYALATSYAFYNPSTNEFYLTSPNLSRIGFFVGGLDFLFLALSFLVVVLNFYRGIFSFEDLSSFYIFFAMIIYSGASLLNLFFIYTRHLTYITFTLVPLLTYIGYKKYLQ